MRTKLSIALLFSLVTAVEPLHASFYDASTGPKSFGTNSAGDSATSTSGAVKSAFLVTRDSPGFGIGTCFSMAGPGSVGAYVDLKVRNTAMSVGQQTTLGAWAFAFSLNTDEFSIDAPGGAPIPVSLNLQLDGTQTKDVGVGAQMADAIFFNYSVSQAGSALISERFQPSIAPPGRLAEGFEFETPKGMFLPGVPISVDFAISIEAEIFDQLLEEELPDPISSYYESDFGSTFSFSTTGPVWNLPEGATIISDITPNNLFMVPEPNSLFMTAIACLLGGFRRRWLRVC